MAMLSMDSSVDMQRCRAHQRLFFVIFADALVQVEAAQGAQNWHAEQSALVRGLLSAVEQVVSPDVAAKCFSSQYYRSLPYPPSAIPMEFWTD